MKERMYFDYLNAYMKIIIKANYTHFNDVTEEEFNNCNVPDKDGLLPDQKDLVYIGIFGLQDTLRQGVRTSVDKCHHAGVKVIMVTGDNLITACSIAKDCNIFPNSVDLNNIFRDGISTKCFSSSFTSSIWMISYSTGY